MRLTDVDALLKCIPYEDVNSRFAVQNAPIIEERKIGKWVITKTERGWNCAEYSTEVTCSNCNYIEDYQKALDFCPNCGADMRER